MNHRYQPIHSFKPSGLQGISDHQIDDHWQLYLGYVNQTNALLDELDQLRFLGSGATLTCADRRRRLGFEFNGMIMHELYFQAMTSDQSVNKLKTNALLAEKIVQNFGSLEAWETDFKNIGKTRGIGWAVLGQNPSNNHLVNYFVQEHENGQIAGFNPILVMDLWEHAYALDYTACGRAKYIDSFVQNINWKVVGQRFTQ